MINPGFWGRAYTLPSLRPNVWVEAGLGLGLGLREGRVGSSPEILIDPSRVVMSDCTWQ